MCVFLINFFKTLTTCRLALHRVFASLRVLRAPTTAGVFPVRANLPADRHKIFTPRSSRRFSQSFTRSSSYTPRLCKLPPPSLHFPATRCLRSKSRPSLTLYSSCPSVEDSNQLLPCLVKVVSHWPTLSPDRLADGRAFTLIETHIFLYCQYFFTVQITQSILVLNRPLYLCHNPMLSCLLILMLENSFFITYQYLCKSGTVSAYTSFK